ncbi:MAG: hypothetical protein ACOY5Y_11370 [Pseudomonadota bacterium]
MKVEISHNVDWAGEQTYNYLVYDFLLSDCRVRARTYADDFAKITLMGRFNQDGSPLPEMLAANQVMSADRPPEQDVEAALSFFKAMDARAASEFPEVLEYLRERFETVDQFGPAGPETIASGFTLEEWATRSDNAGFYQQTTIDIQIDGRSE